MATRKKRRTNILHDQTNGTVNISHGSSTKPQNTGFFGGALPIQEHQAVSEDAGD